MHTALVSGAGSGIGRALATALARRGSSVVVADISGEAAVRTAQEIGGHAAQVDVRDRDVVRDRVERTDRDHGGLDLMVNNAGTGVDGAISTLTAEHWRAQLEVNPYGVMHGTASRRPTR